MITPTDIHATQKASVGQWFELADKALDETGKLMELNLNACRETMEDMAHCCTSACDVRDLSSALSWQTGALKPLAERSAEYGARLVGIASGSGLDYGRAFEAQWESLGRQMSGWMGQTSMAPYAGAGSGSMDYLRQAMQAFDSVWDTMRRNMAQVQPISQPQAHKSSAKSASRKGHH